MYNRNYEVIYRDIKNSKSDIDYLNVIPDLESFLSDKNISFINKLMDEKIGEQKKEVILRKIGFRINTSNRNFWHRRNEIYDLFIDQLYDEYFSRKIFSMYYRYINSKTPNERLLVLEYIFNQKIYSKDFNDVIKILYFMSNETYMSSEFIKELAEMVVGMNLSISGIFNISYTMACAREKVWESRNHKAFKDYLLFSLFSLMGRRLDKFKYKREFNNSNFNYLYDIYHIKIFDVSYVRPILNDLNMSNSKRGGMVKRVSYILTKNNLSIFDLINEHNLDLIIPKGSLKRLYKALPAC